jgi:hypothetical protein
MKALRNIWVTAGLCAIAAVVVIYQFFEPNLHGRGSYSSPKPASAVSPVAPPPPMAPAPVAALPPPAPIETQYARARMAEWIDVPRRDPFLVFNRGLATKRTETNSVVTQLKLQGIWRQTGGRIAAINNKIYSEGDVVEGYRVERIDADQVWFAGPGRNERLAFKKWEVKALAPAGTNTLTTVSGGGTRSGVPRL